jgi:guanylate kinase
MGKIYYIIGKSASGKDTMYKRLMELRPKLRPVIPYTTRPIRRGEQEGVEYHFTTPEELEKLAREGKVIEQRTYETAHGPWTYATVDDGQLDVSGGDLLMTGTPEAYRAMCRRFGREQLVPVYIEVEDGKRLQRALDRERAQEKPRYAELCRRFLADAEDFSEEKLREAGIVRRYENSDLSALADAVIANLAEGRQDP